MPVGTQAELAAELLRLAIADPVEAERRARALLADTQDPWELSVARHALGLVLRERGQLELALPELGEALRFASKAADPDREADVRATLGAALAMSGRTRVGLAQLDRAVRESRHPTILATVLMRRGYVLSAIAGRHRDALHDLEAALEGVKAAGDRVWEARTLNNLGELHLAVGDVAEAELAIVSALDIFRALGQDYESAEVLQNLGFVAFCKGDLPAALSRYDGAAALFSAIGVDSIELAMNRCTTLLTAGLADEATAVIDAQLSREHLQPVRLAELRLRKASALLEGGDPRSALDAARAARDSFRRHRRDWWTARAEMAMLRARYLADSLDRRLARTATDLAAALEAGRADEAVEAWLLAGLVHGRLALPGAGAALRRAAAYRTDRVALVSATGWLALGLERESAGDRRGMFLACRRGLDALDVHRATLGSSELRALATVHGADLAALALAHAVDAPARTFLWWSERWRATSLAQPPIRPEGEEATSAPLAALRDNGRRLHDARSDGSDTSRLEAERGSLEDQVRRRLHHAVGDATVGVTSRLRVERVIEAAGDTSFVELVEVAEVLHAVVVAGGRVRRFRLGPVAGGVQALTYAHFTLRQAARGRPAQVGSAGERLQSALLGPVAAVLADGPVVVSPTSRFHAVPWGLLPVLAERPVTTAPSAGLWLRARSATAPADGGTVFVTGPGLASGGAEVPVVAGQSPDAVSLGGCDATVDATLAALDGARLAHLAAHGHFRQDSPMFSSIALDDGPLVVHDFERLRRAPYRVVLSACESGVMKPVGADELLGLGAALLSLGTAGIVSSVAVVNDEATVEVMVALHRELRAGAGLADSLLAARQATAHDPTLSATAASFSALGI